MQTQRCINTGCLTVAGPTYPKKESLGCVTLVWQLPAGRLRGSLQGAQRLHHRQATVDTCAVTIDQYCSIFCQGGVPLGWYVLTLVPGAPSRPIHVHGFFFDGSPHRPSTASGPRTELNPKSSFSASAQMTHTASCPRIILLDALLPPVFSFFPSR